MSASAVARILVVDDDPRIVKFVSRALSARGFAVDGAFDGAQGLQLAQRMPYDLMVLDLPLPDMEGVSPLHAVMKARPEQRVVVLSALSDVDTKVRCLDLGASDYVTKPFAMAELVARVRARLREPPSAPASRWLRGGPITLDLQRRVADLGDRQVNLSPREFLLLKRLLEKDEVCTRDELLADVWGYWFDPGSNVVDACIRRLRSKLGSQVIETVRNVGYRLRTA